MADTLAEPDPGAQGAVGRPALPAAGPELRIWNAALSFAGETIPLSGPAGVSFEASAPPAPDSTIHLLELASRSEDDRWNVALAPTEFPFAEKFGAALSLDDLSALPAGLRGALEIAVCDVWMRAFEAFSTLRRTGGTTLEAVPDRDVMEWFLVSLEGVAPAPCRALLGLRPDRIARFLAGAGLADGLTRTGIRYPDLAARIPCPARVSAGEVALALDELQALAVGDLLVTAAADDTGADDTGAEDEEVGTGTGETGQRLRLIVGRERLLIARDDEGWRLVGRRDGRNEKAKGEEGMTEEASAEDEPIERDPPSVILDLDIGSVELSLAELQGWSVGAVLPLALPETAAAEVTVRLNGKAVARGNLVQLDDRLGVQLTRVLL